MNCPTCDHTMECVGYLAPIENARGVFWCPRCGTVQASLSGATTPMLVDRCRNFRAVLAGFGTPELTALWYTARLAECINTPQNRGPMP